MFEPGYLHRAGLENQPAFFLDLYYQARYDAQEDPMLHFHMVSP